MTCWRAALLQEADSPPLGVPCGPDPGPREPRTPVSTSYELQATGYNIASGPRFPSPLVPQSLSPCFFPVNPPPAQPHESKAKKPFPPLQIISSNSLHWFQAEEVSIRLGGAL